MMSELQEGPLTPLGHRPDAPPPAPQKLTGREQRRRRRARRRRGEEMLAWVLVPLIVVGIYFGITAALDFLGTSPGQVWDQLMQVKAMMDKRGV